MDRLVVRDQEAGQDREARDRQDVPGPDVERIAPDFAGVLQEIAGQGSEREFLRRRRS